LEEKSLEQQFGGGTEGKRDEGRIPWLRGSGSRCEYVSKKEEGQGVKEGKDGDIPKPFSGNTRGVGTIEIGGEVRITESFRREVLSLGEKRKR